MNEILEQAAQLVAEAAKIGIEEERARCLRILASEAYANAEPNTHEGAYNRALEDAALTIRMGIDVANITTASETKK